MAGKRQLPDIETIKDLRRGRLRPDGTREKPRTLQQIGDMYDVTDKAVYQQLRNAGETTPRVDDGLTPWVVKIEHQKTPPMEMLRLLRRRKAGKPNRPDRERMLDSWLEKIDKARVVVCYHEDMPPNPASPKSGGHYYSLRRPEDGDNVSRPNPADEADEAEAVDEVDEGAPAGARQR